MKNPIAITFLIIGLATYTYAQKVIPQPYDISIQNQNYNLPKVINVAASTSLNDEVTDLSNYLASIFQIKTKPSDQKKANIKLLIQESLNDRLGKEGYELTINAQGVQIDAASATGIFYGIQSIKQLINKRGDQLQLPYSRIMDKPKFAWRSFMLDEGRYFKGKEVVKKMLDEMALLKMNIFHWHLTEDQGWRIAIDEYPELTRIGGKRDSTEIGGWKSDKYDGKEHQGYYSKADIKEIIAYATARHIQIVPEIEMPGHSSAAIAAYPWLGVTKEAITVPTSFGVKYDVYDVTDPKVIQFLHQVLKEVIALFPSNVIHIGGDEVKFKQWEESQKVQQYMKERQLNSSADLQIYFTNGISTFLAEQGKRMMGWNDITGAKLHDYSDQKLATGQLASETIIQFWKGDLDMVKDAVSKGYDVVNSYHEYTYLDYDYKHIPLRKAYEFNPIPDGLEDEYHAKILGLGCQMWGEWIPTSQSMYKQVFPRIAAYAEVGWSSPENKNFDRFMRQLNFFLKRWEREGYEIGNLD
ncbi:beta-N-acetylhexosaminidase [Olivibacter sitiensis]|uniref:beta-N-acetylhexosaminidase n=1 Tax=Olivibacter sitiensis TaxID=376470 RepID=UPI0004232BAF|nr:beta-N-acetylhexosaminidase [Olivibacter sitiensis]